MSHLVVPRISNPDFTTADLWKAHPGTLIESSLIKSIGSLPYPITVLQKGNSDPFNVTAIPLAARNNFALKLASEVQSIHLWTRPCVNQRSRDRYTEQTLAARVGYSKLPMLAVLAWCYVQMLAFKVEGENEHQSILLRYLEYKDASLKELNTLTSASLTFDAAVAIFETTWYLGEVEWVEYSDAAVTHFQEARSNLTRSVASIV